MKKVDYYWKKNRIFKGKKSQKKLKWLFFSFLDFKSINKGEKSRCCFTKKN